MIDGKSDGGEADATKSNSRWMQRGVLAAASALVLGVYACAAHSGYFVSSSLNPADEYYNLLAQGLRAGQLNLKTDTPPGFTRLADPYDPAAHASYPVLDMSYYKGKLYLYFGVTPALVLFWPYLVLTDNYLLQKTAVVIFCFVGFAVSAGLLCALWRRYFAEVGVAVVAAGMIALGLVTCTLFLLVRCDAHEVSISCGYAFTMLALAGVWKALHHPSQQGRWLAASSLAYGLAVGARPDLLFGAVILLIPVAHAWRERQPVWVALMAAIGPMMLIGLGLMLYNARRFDSPFEFGYRYQLTEDRMLTRPFFNLHYLCFNFWVYFLQPAGWSARFPFVHTIAVPPLPAGYVRAETPFGVLTNIPLVWLALAAPLAWRNRSGQERSMLRWFVMSAALLFGICACTVSLFCGSAVRYEVDFLPALVLLAIVGMLGLESALATQPFRRRVVRWVWVLLLTFSVTFNLFASVEHCAMAYNYLGYILRREGRTPEATRQFEQALRLFPDYTDAHQNLAAALIVQGRPQEAIGHYEEVVRHRPSSADAHFNLGDALQKVGRVYEAMAQYEQVLRLKPDYADAHNNLGVVLMGQGRLQEATGHYEQALQLRPDFAEAHINLGNAMLAQGKGPEAIEHYEAALRINSDNPQAHVNLGIALVQAGRVSEAVKHWEEALRLRPDDAPTHYNLGHALQGEGRVTEAIEHYEQALKLNPGFDPARNALARLQTGR